MPVDLYSSMFIKNFRTLSSYILYFHHSNEITGISTINNYSFSFNIQCTKIRFVSLPESFLLKQNGWLKIMETFTYI